MLNNIFKKKKEHMDFSSDLTYDLLYSELINELNQTENETQMQHDSSAYTETHQEASIPDFFSVLNFTSEPDDFEEVQQRFRSLVKSVHPDRPGGSHEDFKRLNEAYKEAKEYYGV